MSRRSEWGKKEEVVRKVKAVKDEDKKEIIPS